MVRLASTGSMVKRCAPNLGYEDNDHLTEGERLTRLLYPTGYFKGLKEREE